LIIVLGFLAALAIVGELTGCSAIQNITGPGQPLTPKQRATLAMKFYTSQYDDYLRQVTAPGAISAERARILQEKYKLLELLEPLVIQFNQYVETGAIFPPASEAQINQLIDRLTALAVEAA